MAAIGEIIIRQIRHIERIVNDTHREPSNGRTRYAFVDFICNRTHQVDRQLVLEFLKGPFAFLHTQLFFEQGKISQLQSQNESSIDKYTRKVKQTIKI